MSNYSMTGVVESITPIQERGNFTWRNLMLKTAKEVKGETYYDYYEFQVSGKNLDTLSETAVGCNAEIFFNIRSREYNGKYYTNLAMWKMSYEPSATVDKKSNDEMVSQATAPTTVVSDDDLPF
jgi:hypothetical protein